MTAASLFEAINSAQHAIHHLIDCCYQLGLGIAPFSPRGRQVPADGDVFVTVRFARSRILTRASSVKRLPCAHANDANPIQKPLDARCEPRVRKRKSATLLGFTRRARKSNTDVRVSVSMAHFTSRGPGDGHASFCWHRPQKANAFIIIPTKCVSHESPFQAFQVKHNIFGSILVKQKSARTFIQEHTDRVSPKPHSSLPYDDESGYKKTQEIVERTWGPLFFLASPDLSSPK